VYELLDEQMEDVIEAWLDTRDAKTLDNLTLFDVFPDDDTRNFETILNELLERIPDFETAYSEAEAIFERRTGTVRAKKPTYSEEEDGR
jgi:hypothetical protein